MLFAATPSQLVSVDPDTGNLNKLYKNCESQSFTTSKYGILSAQTNKPLLLQFGKKESNLKKIVLPEKIAQVLVSPCQMYLVCGAQSGRILVWSLESGQLLCAQDAHFQSVTCLAWSDDSAVLVSGGADARLLVWKLFDLIAQENSEPQVLNGQSLEITDVKLGKGSWREARIYSASKDSTICVYNVANLQRLSTLTLPQPIVSLCLDPVERAIFAATAAGVRAIPLYATTNGRLQALGGLGAVVGCENSTLLECEPTAMILSVDATTLYVGDAQGIITTWDIGTSQLIRRSKPLKGAVVDIAIDDFEPKELVQLQRILGENADIVLDQQAPQVNLQVMEEDVLECWAGVEVRQAVSQETSATTKAEIEALKKKNKDLQALYDKLWAESN